MANEWSHKSGKTEISKNDEISKGFKSALSFPLTNIVAVGVKKFHKDIIRE